MLLRQVQHLRFWLHSRCDLPNCAKPNFSVRQSLVTRTSSSIYSTSDTSCIPTSAAAAVIHTASITTIISAAAAIADTLAVAADPRAAVPRVDADARHCNDDTSLPGAAEPSSHPERKSVARAAMPVLSAGE